jgi:hypothetical protein
MNHFLTCLGLWCLHLACDTCELDESFWVFLDSGQYDYKMDMEIFLMIFDDL